MSRLERRTVMLGVVATLAAGCATGRRPGSIAPDALTAPVVFTITWDAQKRCPTGALLDATAQNCVSGALDCVTLSRRNRNEVIFDSHDPSLDFELFFDPFRGAPMASSGGKRALRIDPGAPANKTYLFYVSPARQPTPPCQPPDPTIIIMP